MIRISFAQRICFAYNTVPHESLANISPFEMDFGSPPVSAFAPPTLEFSPTLANDHDDESQLDLPPIAHISPAAAAAAIQISVAAFHRYAHSHHRYLQQTTADRLNAQGNPTMFQLDHCTNVGGIVALGVE